MLLHPVCAAAEALLLHAACCPLDIEKQLSANIQSLQNILPTLQFLGKASRTAPYTHEVDSKCLFQDFLWLHGSSCSAKTLLLNITQNHRYPMLAGMQYHLSLSRTVPIKFQQIEELMLSLRNQLQDQIRYFQ